MTMMKEFREFAMRGSVLDLAVGVVVGVAFGKVVDSLVNDVIMPPVGLLLGGMDFSNLAVTLKEGTATTPAVLIKYGAFLNTIVAFIIVTLAIFVVLRLINTFRKRQEAAPAPPAQEVLLTEIRDLLKYNTKV